MDVNQQRIAALRRELDRQYERRVELLMRGPDRAEYNDSIETSVALRHVIADYETLARQHAEVPQ